MAGIDTRSQPYTTRIPSRIPIRKRHESPLGWEKKKQKRTMECSVSVEGAVRTPTVSSRISSTPRCGKERGFLAHLGYTRELYSGTASVRSLARAPYV